MLIFFVILLGFYLLGGGQTKRPRREAPSGQGADPWLALFLIDAFLIGGDRGGGQESFGDGGGYDDDRGWPYECGVRGGDPFDYGRGERGLKTLLRKSSIKS